ncbi:MAG: hypothetical protein COB20_06800 [SAR86 cluster bacterium]|uniref:Uncharacterized protein n=1 Tax=SAR86 cluster bacterium TaxID=2030880 RepID=A0A2A4X743_9GAMM|nr:MAG: hypothetical protein COB20_06800 [SAR86 cluster bacterium]
MKTQVASILLVTLLAFSYYAEGQIPVIIGEGRELVAEAYAANRVSKESQGSLIAMLDYLTSQVLLGNDYIISLDSVEDRDAINTLRNVNRPEIEREAIKQTMDEFCTLLKAEGANLVEAAEIFVKVPEVEENAIVATYESILSGLGNDSYKAITEYREKEFPVRLSERIDWVGLAIDIPLHTESRLRTVCFRYLNPEEARIADEKMFNDLRDSGLIPPDQSNSTIELTVPGIRIIR